LTLDPSVVATASTRLGFRPAGIFGYRL